MKTLKVEILELSNRESDKLKFQISSNRGKRDQLIYASSDENQNWFFRIIESPLTEHRNENLGYLALFQLDEEGGFVASIPSLKGCITEGDTFEETLNFLRDALSGWLQVAIEKNLSIPKPELKISL